jgi:hypothetical protein
MRSIFETVLAIFFMMMRNWIAYLVYAVSLTAYFLVPSVQVILSSFIMENPCLALLSVLVAIVITTVAVRLFFDTGGDIEDAYASGRPVGLILNGGIVVFNVSLVYIVLAIIMFVRHVSIVVH